MKVSVETVDGIHKVQVSGRVDQSELANQAEPLREMVGEDVYAKPLLVDMQNVEFLDSCGVGWLLRVHRRCTDAGGKLILHSLPPLVSNVLKILRMQLVLTLVETESEALQSARGAADSGE